MLKKFGAYLLTLLYVITVAGFALNLNYCCSRLTSVKIYSEVKSCAMHMGKSKCCESKHIVVKVKDAHQGQASSFIAKLKIVELPKLAFADFVIAPQQIALLNHHGHDPPDLPLSGISQLQKTGMLRI
jgi:hypothetical protein